VVTQIEIARTEADDTDAHSGRRSLCHSSENYDSKPKTSIILDIFLLGVRVIGRIPQQQECIGI
jgi:hypothetical protein